MSCVSLAPPSRFLAALATARVPSPLGAGARSRPRQRAAGPAGGEEGRGGSRERRSHMREFAEARAPRLMWTQKTAKPRRTPRARARQPGTAGQVAPPYSPLLRGTRFFCLMLQIYLAALRQAPARSLRMRSSTWPPTHPPPPRSAGSRNRVAPPSPPHPASWPSAVPCPRFAVTSARAQQPQVSRALC